MACCRSNVPIDIIQKMIDLAGKDIVSYSTSSGITPLHSACEIGANIDVIRILINAGGKELLLEKAYSSYSYEYDEGYTALHLACDIDGFYRDVNIAKLLLQKGGTELIMEQDEKGRTALHLACKYEEGIHREGERRGIIAHLVHFGGEELVNMKDDEGIVAADYLEGKQLDLIEEALKKDPFFLACFFGMGIDAVKKILKTGGKEMALTRFTNGKTALHAACECNGNQSAIIEYLVLFGGEKLVAMQDDKGKTAAE